MLTIGELSARSGVAPSALRFWEQRGLVRSVRTGGNQRRYQRSELRRVAFIRISQQIGISLERIAQALATLPDERTPTKADWAGLSRDFQADLDERIAVLQRLRDRLTGCVGCGCLSMKTCALYNPGDALAAEGPGPRKLYHD